MLGRKHIEGWGERECVCSVCVLQKEGVMEWLCSCNSQVFDCQGGNGVRLSFCVLTFSGENFFFGGWEVNNQK